MTADFKLTYATMFDPPDEMHARYEAALAKWKEAADQAKVICFLASGDADFVTGLTIDVTGGL